MISFKTLATTAFLAGALLTTLHAFPYQSKMAIHKAHFRIATIGEDFTGPKSGVVLMPSYEKLNTIAKISDELYSKFDYKSEPKWNPLDTWKVNDYTKSFSGDCEDYHLTLMKELIQKGICKPSDIKFTLGEIVDGIPTGIENHAYLKVRVAGKWFVLNYVEPTPEGRETGLKEVMSFPAPV